MTTVTIPTLETSRLVLRAPQAGDFTDYAALLASGRATFLRGPFDRTAAWTDYCVNVAEWVLHGIGPFVVIERAARRFTGLVGVSRHPACPEPEMGWIVTGASEGRSVAFEAASRLRDWAFADAGLPSLVSYIVRGNIRGERLALRLGATLDTSAQAPSPDTRVYRYCAERSLA
ncbi:MAG: RimJ/RimL family protein N-acetyltransferase [Paracoccaceae bacterium]|jgi:RimJ/RimL family protein N-acetyltransferase